MGGWEPGPHNAFKLLNSSLGSVASSSRFPPCHSTVRTVEEQGLGEKAEPDHGPEAFRAAPARCGQSYKRASQHVGCRVQCASPVGGTPRPQRKHGLHTACRCHWGRRWGWGRCLDCDSPSSRWAGTSESPCCRPASTSESGCKCQGPWPGGDPDCRSHRTGRLTVQAPQERVQQAWLGALCP